MRLSKREWGDENDPMRMQMREIISKNLDYATHGQKLKIFKWHSKFKWSKSSNR